MVKVLGYNVFSKGLQDISFKKKGKIIINTINPHSYVVAKKDEIFKKALKASDILLPDGVGIVYAAKWLKKVAIKKIAGADIHEYLISKAYNEKSRIFYLGSSDQTLKLIQERIHKTYPNIDAGFYSPPFKQEFDKDDTNAMIDKINAFSPDILFVGMTAPKQEKWVFENKDKIDAKIIVSIGAVFDFYAGTVKRPGKIWIKAGLEWLPRFFNEPKRLWKRNMVSTPLFILDMLKYKFSR